MPQITMIASDGEAIVVDGAPGLSLMECAREHGVEGIVAECGGNMSCATCHVILDPEWYERIGGPDEDEDAMLETTAAPREPTSRLSCQITVTDALDGLRLRLPEYQL